MYPLNNTITLQNVYECATNQIKPYLGLTDHGPKCTVDTSLQVLFYAAANRYSISEACGQLQDAPTDQAIRDALKADISDRTELEAHINDALIAQLTSSMRRKSWRMAIDLVLLPYYGQAHHNTQEIFRSVAKAGTTHFHAYATAYIAYQGERFTVSLTIVEHNETMDVVVQRLLRSIRDAGLHVKLLLLDRGFYSVNVIRYLKAAHYPFIMPAVRRGRKPNHPKGPSGTYRFAAEKKSGWFYYTLENQAHDTATVRICVHCHNQRPPKHGRCTFIYAVWGVKTNRTNWIYNAYGKRFGIETSYRQVHEARIKTSTRNPLLRLLFVGIACLLRNLWVWLHYQVLATPHQGARQLHLERLHFRTMLCWLAYAVIAILNLINFIGISDSS